MALLLLLRRTFAFTASLLLLSSSSKVASSFLHLSRGRTRRSSSSNHISIIPLPKQSLQSPCFIKTTTTTSVSLSKEQDNEDSSKNVDSSIDSPASPSRRKEEDFDLLLPVVGSIALFVALGFFLVGEINDPTSGFDVDMFMSLKNMLDSSNSNNQLLDSNNDVMELPSLSPGERIVDVFFGSPSSGGNSKYGEFF